MQSPQPLWALWRFSSDPRIAAFTVEFMALANHRKELRDEFARYGELFRDRERRALADALQRYGIDASEVPPVVWAVFATSLSRTLVMETALGMSSGHSETLEFVEDWLRQLEGEPVATAATVTTTRA